MKKVCFTTTLNRIWSCNPCRPGWEKLVRYLQEPERNETINILTIVDSNGVQDAMWALCAVIHPRCEEVSRLIACDFTEKMLPYYHRMFPAGNHLESALEVARLYAKGEASAEQMSEQELVLSDLEDEVYFHCDETKKIAFSSKQRNTWRAYTIAHRAVWSAQSVVSMRPSHMTAHVTAGNYRTTLILNDHLVRRADTLMREVVERHLTMEE